MADTRTTLITSLQNITRELGKEPTENLWSKDEWTEYLNEAQDEICIRALVLGDDIDIDLEDGVASYDLIDQILEVNTITFSVDENLVLTVKDNQRSEEWLNTNVPGWRTMTAAPPSYYMIKNKTITFIPTLPTEFDATVATMSCKVLPTNMLSSTNPNLEISARYHSAMRYWALYRAYQKKDSQTFDDKASAFYYGLFVKMVGERPSYKIEQIDQEESSDMRIGVVL